MNKRIARKKLKQWIDQCAPKDWERLHKWEILAKDRRFRIIRGYSIQSLMNGDSKEEDRKL